MNSFSSASQTCEPLPRTINRGSPPTERNARTGEFTPPGIMLSARNWRRRDCSVLCDVVDSIDSSRHGEMRCQRIGPVQPNTIAVPLEPISSDIHGSVIPLQHRDSTLDSSSRPSNREGFEGQSRGLRTVLFLFSLGRPRHLALTTINTHRRIIFPMITVSKEDYLKSILEAESEGEAVISARLAALLKVSPPRA